MPKKRLVTDSIVRLRLIRDWADRDSIQILHRIINKKIYCNLKDVS